jgi:DUF2993 family protein
MSRRRSGCLLSVLVLLLLVVVVLVVADRVAVRIAEGRVAEQIAGRGGLAGTPDVDITGVPFLTQAAAGTYRDVRVELTADELGQPAGTRADISLRGVHVPLSDVLSGSVQQVPVDRVDGTATLSYELLAQQLGGDTTLAADGDRLRITGTIQVLGLDLPLTAVGTVRLDGQDVVLDVQSASAGGANVPAPVLRRAAEQLDLRYPIPALPFGLQVTGVRPGAEGVDVRVTATDTVLSG